MWLANLVGVSPASGVDGDIISRGLERLGVPSEIVRPLLEEGLGE